MQYRIEFTETVRYVATIESETDLPTLLESDDLSDEDWFPLVDAIPDWFRHCLDGVTEREVVDITPQPVPDHPEPDYQI